MQKLAGSIPRPTSLSGVLCGRYAVGLCRKRQDRLSFAQAGENASGCPPARRARLGCDCSSLSPLTLKPLRSPTPCPFTAIATALLSGYAAHAAHAAHAAARSMVTASVASGLGFSVVSLPHCRRGAFSASIRAVRRLLQGRYAVDCAAARQEKEKRFCKCFCRLFFKQLRGWGERLRVLVKARSGRNTRTSVFLVVPCNHRPTETRFRWAIVDGERVVFHQKLRLKSVPYVG